MDIKANLPGASHAQHVEIPCIVFFALTPIFVIMRIWSRLSKGSKLGADDWTIVVSFICALIVQILMMISVAYGFGQHVFNLTHENKHMALKLFYVAQIFYKLTINLTKTSILLLYLRIFVQRWFRCCCWGLAAVVLSYMVATTASSIWQCNPIEGAWDKSTHPVCISLTRNWYANAGFSIATDILILCLPMQPIWSSRLSRNSKMALILIFALGGFVTITSILRATTLNFSTKTPDPTYDIASTLWTIIEENVAIICACLPMCRTPLSFFFPTVFGTTDAASGRASDGAALYHSSYPHGSSNRTRSRHGEWEPYSGGRKGETVTLSVHENRGNVSEEHILDPYHHHHHHHHQVPAHAIVRSNTPGAITKTTQYEVVYETEAPRSGASL